MEAQEKSKQICFNILYEKALAAVKAVTLEEAYTLTRLKISYLKKFRAGRIPNPSVQKIERILVCMTGEASTNDSKTK